jgi:hypothetical protein
MTTAISTQTQPARGLALQSLDDAFKFAAMVAKSDVAPKDFKGKPESCLLAIQHGSEVGLSPMQSLQSIAVINGRPTIWGDAALALVQSSPVCEYVAEYIDGEGDAMTAVCEVKRRGYPTPHVARFSVADAKKAGLWGKAGPWQQYPQRMLALRARGFALRNTFADALRGLITAEEAQDYPQAEQAAPPAKTHVEVRPRFTATVSQPVSVTETAEGRARLAIGRATSIELLDTLRTLVDTRHREGVFSDATKAELVDLIHHKAEMLIASEEQGQEFAHEAAEHEVTA